MSQRAPRRNRRSKGKQFDLWRSAQPLPEATPIEPAEEATAMIRSLGPPPLPQAGAGEHYLALVVERASQLALALGYSAGLVVERDAADDAEA